MWIFRGHSDTSNVNREKGILVKTFSNQIADPEAQEERRFFDHVLMFKVREIFLFPEPVAV